MSGRMTWPMKLGAGMAMFTAAYYIDSEFNAKTFQRNLRTLYHGICLTFNYKFRFKPGADINAIHQDAAERILVTCQKNGGLYIKFGQGVASMNHLLPPQYNETLRSLFKDAPIVPFDDVIRTFKEEFGKHPDEIFRDFERTPVASASIAQVHRAKLLDGTPVAVKVQKEHVRRQLPWDLWTYRMVLHVFEYLFELPLNWSAEYTEDHLRQEVNFVIEAKNAERASADFEKESRFSGRVHVPRVYWDQTTERIMTSEWIDGLPLTDPKTLTEAGFSLQDVMETVVSIFAYQIFQSGFVHADPHPGNIIIRKSSISNRAEVCLLDHGLYVEETDKFRQQYCQFWKALFVMDHQEMQSITRSWGIEDVNMFASATLQRPYNPKKAVHLGRQNITMDDVYRMQMVTKERIKQFLSDTEKIPRELIFVGRNLNLVRSNNKYLGSPVNRVNIMVGWAVRGVGSDWSFWAGEAKESDAGRSTRLITSIKRYLYPRVNFWIFQTQLMLLSISFHFTRLVQRVGEFLTRSKWSGFEDILDRQMADQLRERLGIVINEEAFSA